MICKLSQCFDTNCFLLVWPLDCLLLKYIHIYYIYLFTYIYISVALIHLIIYSNTKHGDYRWYLQVGAFTKLIFRGFVRCLHV